MYDFSGNRDIDFVLQLCKKLQLFVLAAPSPYICAETQGGGLPLWLLAKRDVRIRHSWGMFFRKYDPKYSFYCRQYFANILPILRKHQITEYPDGCIIALQIENEMFEMLKILPIGLMDDMRYLCKAARDFGMTVPFFTNDGFEEGSFNANKSKFGVDLYGFDKYVIFMPASSISSAIFGSDRHSGYKWSTKTFINSLDGIEKRVRSFGGGAASQFLYQSCRAVGLTIIP